MGTDQELLFSDTEPMDAAGKAPNPPNEFLEARQTWTGTLVRGRGRENQMPNLTNRGMFF